ncbi:hypothetical protein BH11ACT2_BH11ACT2_06300 [soil metagenome]
MSAELVITGGGSYAVATDDQLARVQRLESFTQTARLVLDQLAAVNGSLTEPDLRAAQAPAAAFAAERELAAAIAVLGQIADRAELGAKLTRAAMLRYGATEREREAAARDLYGALASYLGFLAGSGVAVAGGVAVAVMGGLSTDVDGATAQEKGPATGPLTYLSDHPELYSDARFVEAVKLLVDSLDDLVFSSAYLPPAIVEKLKGLGLGGPALAAAVLVASGAPTGKLVESDVALTGRTARVGPGTAPGGWQDRIARIPHTAHNGGYQIRIDKFVDASGKRSFEVYLSGTQSFSTSRTSSPFDFTGDVNGLAGKPNGALAAVEKAMRAAGVERDDPVNITGHSEGGLVAHEVAATGRWNVAVALEAGPPAAHTAIPEGTTEVVLAHNEDVVTALGGSRDDDTAIVVHTTAFPDGTVPTGESTPPAHNTQRYEQTAHLLDEAASTVITDAKEKMNASERGASGTMTTTLYKAERLSSG